MAIDAALIDRLFRDAQGDRWHLSKARLAEALESSLHRTFPGQPLTAAAQERYLRTLHLHDLALACACADKHEPAWEHFVREQRPLLYRAADLLDPAGGARDLADSLYAELFGLSATGAERRSLFHYFHGRSSLTTWLRAVLAQRHVDRLRTNRRTEALPDDDSSAAVAAPARAIDPDRQRYSELMQATIARVVAALQPDDRLRLACYYAQQLTLAQTGRLLGEHEATVSRHLARTRKRIREDVTRELREAHNLNEAEIDRCFECITEDAGTLDLRQVLGAASGRKESALDRSS